MNSATPARSEGELRPDERRQLQEAHRKLRDAVAAYEPFIGRPLSPVGTIPVHSAADVASAQKAIEEAEQELWRLREQLLGWRRPGWAPEAATVAEWFSAEDAVYDDMTAAPGE